MPIHELVDIDRWVKRYPVADYLRSLDRKHAGDWQYRPPHDIQKPSDLALTEQMRKLAQVKPTLDVKGVSLLLPMWGEPRRRDETKISGLPYLRAADWPKRRNTPLLFLAQINFHDSKHLLPADVKLPGDLLLLFVANLDDLFGDDSRPQPLHCVWIDHCIPDPELITSEQCPQSIWSPTHFQMHRSTESAGKGSFVWGKTTIEVGHFYSGSKIGGRPVWQQRSPARSRGTFIAALHSVNPYGSDFPFPNVEKAPWGDGYGKNFFMLGDLGTLYLFWDGKQIRWTMQCG